MSHHDSAADTVDVQGSQMDEFQVRILLYDLAKSLFVREPDMETCQKWKTIFGTFAQMEPLAPIRMVSDRINEILDKKGCEGVLMEYHALFMDPYGKSRLNTTLSWYEDGRNFGPVLAKVRQLMQDAGIEKRSSYHEPEDSIEVLMDTMIQLMTRDDGNYRQFQGRLFMDYIQPLVHSLTGRMEEMDEFPFYQACAAFLKEWLEMEQEFHTSESSLLS